MQQEIEWSGTELKQWRKQLSLTQQAAAELLGLTRVSVGLMERDKHKIEKRTVLSCLYLQEHPELLSAIDKGETLLYSNMKEISPQIVEVRFAPPGYKTLYFDMVFVVGTQGRIVETSDTMWDINRLETWINEIAEGKLIAEMDVDREGAIDTLRVTKIDELRCHFQIFDHFSAERYQPDKPLEVFVDAIVSRKKLVWEIYFEMQKWAQILRENNRHFVGESESDPNWLKNPLVEEWLNWDKCKTGLYDDICDPGYR